MSKYFDQARQMDSGAGLSAVGNRPDVQEVLEGTAKSVGASKDQSETFLSQCRKIQLPLSSASPVIFPRNDFAAVALESYRALRARLLSAQSNQRFRSVVITSAAAAEGKTLTAMNLALCCAQVEDFRVLVVDSDLRTFGLTRLFGQTDGPGLGNILQGEAKYEEAILRTQNPNLFLLGAGTLSHPAPELFSGKRWEDFVIWCSSQFSLTLVDSPPVLAVADFEQIISTCDTTLVVVRARKTQREMLRKAALRIDPKKLLGAVFNGAHVTEQSEYMGYGGPPSHGSGSKAQTSSEELTPAQMPR